MYTSIVSRTFKMLTISAEPVCFLQVCGVLFDLIVVFAGILGLEPLELMNFQVLVQVAGVAEAIVVRGGGLFSGLAEPDNGVGAAHAVDDVPVVASILVEAVVLLTRGTRPAVAKLVGDPKVLAAKVAVDLCWKQPSQEGQRRKDSHASDYAGHGLRLKGHLERGTFDIQDHLHSVLGAKC